MMIAFDLTQHNGLRLWPADTKLVLTRLRSMTNMLILNLAVADSLIMLFGLPEIVLFMMNDGWRLGLVLCKVDRTVLVAALYSSVLTLVAVCIERYIAIVFPFKAHILCTKTRMCKLIAIIWLASCACATPTAIFNRVRRLSETPPRDFCLTEFHVNRSEHKRYNQAFKYTESVLFYVIPLLLQMVCYTVIGTRLFVGLEKLHRTTGGSGCVGLGGGGGISSASRLNGRGPPSRGPNSEPIRARRGVVKMLIACVVIYFVSYSPHQVLLIYRTFWNSKGGFDQTWMFHVFTTILAYINSAANPVLYCIFSDNFRSNFKVIFARLVSNRFCRKCCRSECSPRNRHGSAETQRAITLHSYTCTTEYSTMARKYHRHSTAVPL
ncbi:neuropeptide receptor 15-like [Plakobranchus ocellatus]|uniref:Neuropeptide receptor 15-like n=1 Tax=Plakobranchus ocellatus TaxID=259542 RepID=A0AAV4BMM4_9GAST|nr:neuropeptide receptor 15-like [Plakobranchus ocellatus]